MMGPLVAGCLLLATATVTVQTTPQRVERVEEYRWCPRADGTAVVRHEFFRVDARVTHESDTTLLHLSEQSWQNAPLELGTGP